MVTHDLAFADLRSAALDPADPATCALCSIFSGAAPWARKTAGALACAAVGASFALALYVFWQLPANGVFRDLVYTWIDSGSFKVNLSLPSRCLDAR